jgi:hypothetical protein
MQYEVASGNLITYGLELFYWISRMPAGTSDETEGSGPDSDESGARSQKAQLALPRSAIKALKGGISKWLFRPLRVLTAVDALWRIEVGTTPEKNDKWRFLAAFLGAYVGTFSVGITWFFVWSLWGALKSFLTTFVAAENLLPAVAFAMIAVGFAMIFIPALISLMLAWIVSGSSRGRSTRLTLFLRGLYFPLLLLVFILAVFLILLGVRSAMGRIP